MKLSKSKKDLIGYFINVVVHPRTPKPDPSKRILACVGDSLTYGAGVRFTRQRDSYPAQLGALLGDEWQVLNYGLSWRTLQDTGDLPYKSDRFFQESLKCGAEIYLLMLGSNDAKYFNWNEENYRQELRSFVKAYQALPQKPVVLLMQPTIAWRDRHGREPFGVMLHILEHELHDIIAEIGAETGCRVIDLYRLSEAHPDWFHDASHPNQKGNRMIAHYIRGVLYESYVYHAAAAKTNPVSAGASQDASLSEYD